MVTKESISYLIIVLLGAFSIASSCNKTTSQCYRYYRFEEPIKISPIKDTIKIGDTIYLEINTSTNMLDINENEHIELMNHGIITFLNFYRISSNDKNGVFDPVNPAYNGALDDFVYDKFNFITNKGKWTRVSDLAAKIEYEIRQGNFVHKTKIIAQDTGQFYFQFLDAYAYYFYSKNNPPNLISTDCYQRWDNMKYTVNDGKCNFFLMKDMNITIVQDVGTWGETQKYNFEHGSWSFVVVPKSTP